MTLLTPDEYCVTHLVKSPTLQLGGASVERAECVVCAGCGGNVGRGVVTVN